MHWEAVIVRMKDGSEHALDRALYPAQVAKLVNDERTLAQEEGRQTNLLLFSDNQTPAREVWIDPSEVSKIS